tara:strand:- start:3962 stop:4240 length:279 start_codon:yes stop_codon:yes gene_type:complete
MYSKPKYKIPSKDAKLTILGALFIIIPRAFDYCTCAITHFSYCGNVFYIFARLVLTIIGLFLVFRGVEIGYASFKNAQNENNDEKDQWGKGK